MDPPSLRGYYNDNRPVEHEGRRALLRAPLREAEAMDVRPLPEPDVLAFVGAHGFPAPRLLARRGDAMIVEYVEGWLLHDAHPRSEPLPDAVPLELGRRMRRLHALDPAPLARLAPPLAPPGDAAAFFEALRAFALSLHERHRGSYGRDWRALGVPERPFDALSPPLSRGRAWALCHCDVHRKNLVDAPGRGLVWLDWDLALVGDPLYDVAVHLHKMRYAPPQEAMFLEAYGVPDRHDVDRYLALERAKSCVVDFVRYAREVRAGLPEDAARALATHYAGKLRRAWPMWHAQGEPPTEERVLALLRGEG